MFSGGLNPIHLLIIAVALLLLFGGSGKISGLMGDAAKGIKAFRDGMKDEPPAGTPPEQPAVLTAPEPPAKPAPAPVREDVSH